MKYFKFFVLVFVALGICHLRAMPSDVPVDREKMDKSVELIVARLPLHVDDPLKELEDTEEEEAFDYITRSQNLDTCQVAQLSQVASGYIQILYDFPFAYPNYDNLDEKCIQSTHKKYSDRIDKLNNLMYKAVEWI